MPRDPARARSLCRFGAITLAQTLDDRTRFYLPTALNLAATEFRRAATLAPCCADRVVLLDLACRALASDDPFGDGDAPDISRDAFAAAERISYGDELVAILAAE